MVTAGAAIEADYLIVGAGAMGMAFADVLMTESAASIVIVDKHDRPGGHWNDSYPFVRLHQPSAFYGVNSRPLGNDTIDATGWNKGLYELASGTEVVTYFEQVMQQQFLPTGRVQYFPMTEHVGDGVLRSVVTGSQTQVRAGKTVDATYMDVQVPSTRRPQFEVADGVDLVPLNELPRCAFDRTQYTIVGAGKTGMDAVLWLLRNEVDPDRIGWIMPRDSWLLDRKTIQPGPEFGVSSLANFANQMEAIANAASVDDMFDRLSAAGCLLRLDDTERPSMYRCATVTQAELEQLRRVRNVVRKGRVQHIDPSEMVLEGGSIPMSGNHLVVDCSADGLAKRPSVSVFDGDQLTLQSVRTCQQVFSAAFIGHVEATYDDESEKNRLCTPVPHPDTDIDFLRVTLASGINGANWAQDTDLQEWLVAARLDGFSRAVVGDGRPSAEVAQLAAGLQANALPAMAKLQQLIAESEA